MNIAGQLLYSQIVGAPTIDASVSMDGGAAANWRMDAPLSGAVCEYSG